MTDGHENDGPSKLQNMKLQDKNTVLTEITIQYNDVCNVHVFVVGIFLDTKHSNALCVS